MHHLHYSVPVSISPNVTSLRRMKTCDVCTQTPSFFVVISTADAAAAAAAAAAAYLVARTRCCRGKVTLDAVRDKGKPQEKVVAT